MPAERTGGVFLLLCLTATAWAGDVEHETALYHQAMYSATLIHVTRADGDYGGSGVLIDAKHRYVLTAWHVVKGASRIYARFALHCPDESVAYYPDEYRDPRITLINQKKCRLVCKDELGDLALLQLDSLPDSAAPMAIAATSCVPGTPLLCIGSGGLDGPLWRHSAGRSKQIREGRVGSHSFLNSRCVETTLRIFHGDSGGPIFNERCELVGITTAFAKDGTSGIGTDIVPIRRLLQGKELYLAVFHPSLSKPGDFMVYGVRHFLADQSDAGAAYGYWVDIDASGKCKPPASFGLSFGQPQPPPGSLGNPAVVNGGLPK